MFGNPLYKWKQMPSSKSTCIYQNNLLGFFYNALLTLYQRLGWVGSFTALSVPAYKLWCLPPKGLSDVRRKNGTMVSACLFSSSMRADQLALNQILKAYGVARREVKVSGEIRWGQKAHRVFLLFISMQCNTVSMEPMPSRMGGSRFTAITWQRSKKDELNINEVVRAPNSILINPVTPGWLCSHLLQVN